MSSDHMTQSVQEQIGILPAIEPEGHLIQVGGEMLCADLVPRSHDAALQERECGLYGIGVNVALNVNPITMTDGFVLRAMNASGNHCLGICWHLICDHYINIGANVFLDVLRKSSSLRIAGVEESEVSAALTDADY